MQIQRASNVTPFRFPLPMFEIIWLAAVREVTGIKGTNDIGVSVDRT